MIIWLDIGINPSVHDTDEGHILKFSDYVYRAFLLDIY